MHATRNPARTGATFTIAAAIAAAGLAATAAPAQASIGSHYVRLDPASSASNLLVDPGPGHAKVVIHRGQRAKGTIWNTRIFIGAGFKICNGATSANKPRPCTNGPVWVNGGYLPGTYTPPIYRR